ncbi:MAG: DUF3105 domain-containing protein [Nitrospiraceae bacterium]
MEQGSRQERRHTERQRRKEQRQKEKERWKGKKQLQRLLSYLIGILLLAGAGYWGYTNWATTPSGEFIRSLGNRHITSSRVALTTYNSDPPTSGPHLPSIAHWGIHERPIPKELQVHNLEDGGVLVQYSCDRANQECRELVDKLAKIVRRYNHAILAPYPGVTQKIALTAWTRIDKFNEFDEKRIVRFIDAYIDVDHHAHRGR